MHLYLIRHGESWVNRRDRPDNQPIDASLTDLGERQASAVAKWMTQEVSQVDALYTSTMRRAEETSQIIADAYGCSILPDDRLREIGNNRHDHTPLPGDSLPRQYTTLTVYQNPVTPIATDVENVETFMHFRIRVAQFIEEILVLHRDKTVLAVCHGGVINVAVDHIFNVGAFRRCDIRGMYTSVTYFRYVGKPNREPWHLNYLGRVDHLVDIV
jgi:probable phosphoglycerate mutase